MGGKKGEKKMKRPRLPSRRMLPALGYERGMILRVEAAPMGFDARRRVHGLRIVYRICVSMTHTDVSTAAAAKIETVTLGSSAQRLRN